MKSKKNLLVFLFLALFSLSNAQDKYEFLVISFYPVDGSLVINMDGKDYLEEKIKWKHDDSETKGVNPLLKKVKEFQDQNWEVMSFNTNSVSQFGKEAFYFYLKRKKKS